MLVLEAGILTTKAARMRARTHAGAMGNMVITELKERSTEKNIKGEDTMRKWTAVKQVEGMLILGKHSTSLPQNHVRCRQGRILHPLVGHEEPHSEGNLEEVTLDRHPGHAMRRDDQGKH